MAIRFTWDSDKAERNLRTHGVSFEAAATVFDDPFLVTYEDCNWAGEVRYHALGYTTGEKLVVAVYLEESEEGDDLLHIISARKAEDFEKSIYADQFE